MAAAQQLLSTAPLFHVITSTPESGCRRRTATKTRFWGICRAELKKLGVKKVLLNRLASFADAIERELMKRRSEGNRSRVLSRKQLEEIFFRHTKSFQWSWKTLTKWRPRLVAAGVLQAHVSGWYVASCPQHRQIPPRGDSICGQNASNRKSVQKFEGASIKTKSLPAQPAPGRCRDQRGRFVKSDDAAQCEGLGFEANAFRSAASLASKSVDVADPGPSKASEAPTDARQGPLRPTTDAKAFLAQLEALAAAQRIAGDRPKAREPREPKRFESLAEISERLLRNAPKSVAAHQPYRRPAQLDSGPPPAPAGRQKPQAIWKYRPSADDHLLADADWCTYRLRTVPFLRRTFPSALIRLRCTRKVWRMAVAAAISRWPGQLSTCRAAYCIGVAKKYAAQKHFDPRASASYRVTYDCEISQQFAGVFLSQTDNEVATSHR